MSIHAQGNQGTIACAVITVSDTRTVDTDRSGKVAQSLVREAGFSVASYALVPDEPHRVRQVVVDAVQHADAVLLSGGTGVSPRDITFEALADLLDKALTGFGELFRVLSYAEIGAAAMLSRAFAGICRGTPVFAMPGSPNAVSLALRKLILPELPHLVAVLRQTPP